MGIQYDKEKRLFHISTANSSYVMGIAADGIVTHIYYGKRLAAIPNLAGIYMNEHEKNWIPEYDKKYPNFSLAKLPQEYPTFGSGDYRTPALKVEYDDGSKITKLLYSSHKTYDGKPKLKGLPAVYTEEDSEAQTLEIRLQDCCSKMYVVLLYTVMEEHDAIIRSVRIVNDDESSIILETVHSASFDCENIGYEVTYLGGAWARERHLRREKVPFGNFVLESRRGASSHVLNPFIALSEKNADETRGEVLGLSLVYSGNFAAGIESDDEDIRVFMGINSFDFKWNLNPGEEFQTPEVVMVFSEEGFGRMSRCYHKLYRTRLCRGTWRDKKRPVLINNWEATYFDFNEEKIIDIARKASECGVELMVLDDGWFGKRNNDDCSLGDWVANRTKLPSGIEGLADRVEKLGMRFGLWFEPEMVSPDSELYRAHPDWCLHVEGRSRSEVRNQLILDLSRQDVCDYIVDALSQILKCGKVSYVKWDMNRNMSEAGSDLLDGRQQSEVAHRYILGLYQVLERITSLFPDVLFESCAGGGGRFDPGMMYYMPQGWTSDDTDAVERLSIQYGSSMVYASSMMGAHVSAVPNHQVGRTTPIQMRGLCAMGGRLGYELNLASLSEAEIEAVKSQIHFYHQYEDVLHKGDMYRLLSPFAEDAAAFEYISEDKSKILLFYFCIKGTPMMSRRHVRMAGLEPLANYRNVETGEIYAGDTLMNIGMLFKRNQDHIAECLVFERR